MSSVRPGAVPETIVPPAGGARGGVPVHTGRALYVGVLNNPLSGKNRKRLDAIRRVQAEHPMVPHCEVRTPAEVAAALDDFARKGVDVVAVNGGDGTVQAVLTALFRRKPFETPPLLAVLPVGTTGMIAGDVGLRGAWPQALRRLFAWARAGDREAVILERPVLRVQAPPDREPLFGMFFGTAGIYQGIQFCRTRIHRLGLRGELGPGLTLIRFLLSLARRHSDYIASVPITIGLDGQPPEQRDCLALFVSTLERLFLGLRPYWGTETGPLYYTAVSARPQHILRALPSLLRGRPSRQGTPDHGYFSHNVHEVQLALQSGFTLDGELFKAEGRLGPVVLRDGGQVSFIRW